MLLIGASLCVVVLVIVLIIMWVALSKDDEITKKPFKPIFQFHPKDVLTAQEMEEQANDFKMAIRKYDYPLKNKRFNAFNRLRV